MTPEDKARRTFLYRQRHAKDPSKQMFLAAKARAKKRGLPFSIERKDIVVPKLCPVLGIELAVGEGRHLKDSAPSIDRFVQGLGYVKENIRIISWRANSLKSDATVDELERVLKYMKGQL